MPQSLTPKLLTVLRQGYSIRQFSADAGAGVIVGIVALPLAIAFAIASGVKPEQGLYTAIIAGVIVAVLGGSRVQIAGPTGAFIVVVYRIVQTYGYDGLAIATLLAGAMLIIMGLARLGSLLRFVPYPLTVGFTSGIALIIFSSQLNDFLGLRIADLPADAGAKWAAYLAHLPMIDWASVAVGSGSLLVVVGTRFLLPRIPGSLLAILAATAVVQLLHLPVETIGTRFGTVPNALPAPALPAVSWETLPRLFTPALTIAMLGAIESLLSAVVADGMIRARHRPNMELIAQGIANMVSPLFAGIPATGAIARTVTNIKSGGRTPVAGIVHAGVLLVVMLVAGQWAILIPLPTLAAILIVVAYNMSEWRSFVKTLRSPRSDVAVMLVTFVLTVAVDLTAALQAGIILSAMLFIRRMAEVSQITPVTRDLRDPDGEQGPEPADGQYPSGVEVFEVFGTLFFGAVEQFTETIRGLGGQPRLLVLETRNLLAIDASGIRAVEDLITRMTHQGTRVMISGIHKQPLMALTKAGIVDRLGEENLCGNIEEGIRRWTEGESDPRTAATGDAGGR